VKAPHRCAGREMPAGFLDRCRLAAGGARVALLPGRSGIAADYQPRANPSCRSILDGHAPELRHLVALHVRARCAFRVPVEAMPAGARIVDDGADREVLLAGQEGGQGEPIAAEVLLDADGLISSLLLPEGLEAFAREYLPTARGSSELIGRFTATDVSFEIINGDRGAELWCRFTAEMDA